jgi:hypothetical protein
MSTTMASARYQFFTRRPDAVEWRLISANNWELGRGAAPVRTLEDCLTIVLEIGATIDGFVEEVLPDPRGGWRWRLLRDGAAVAVSSRSFLRRVECESTLAQFRKLAGVAPVVPRLRTFR